MRFRHHIATNGKGLWSSAGRDVQTTRLSVPYRDEDFGELRVHFTRRSWDVKKHGLIYTDRLWLAGLRKFLPARIRYDVDYSEQGMQGDDYVSLDVGGKFLRWWDLNGRPGRRA